MIDLHSHILPGVDDGAADEAEALAMARLFVEDGVTDLACTPHIYPGVYNNRGQDIEFRIGALQARLDEEGIPLRLTSGADCHIAPDLVSKLRDGTALSLNKSRYVLVEPPHHVLPPRTEDLFFSIAAAGYVPILTHPERMSWIEQRYELVQSLARSGVWMQLTAASIVGDFGKRAKYWSERMLDEGIVQIVASDAHNTTRRPPRMRAAFDIVSQNYSQVEAAQLFEERPRGILQNRARDEMFVYAGPYRPVAGRSLLQRLGRLLGVRGR